MGLFSIILFFICVISLFICSHFLKRNEKVCQFRLRIVDICSNYNITYINKKQEYNDTVSAYKWCYAKLPSYEQMLYSTKPLRLTQWVPADDLIKLKTLIHINEDF
jgi:hypothetical protein